MKKKLAFILFYILPFFHAQKFGVWTDLFSYNNVLVIKKHQNKIIAATENGIFYYIPENGEITKLSKVNGLNEVKITAFDFNSETGIGLVGYKSGSLDVITPEGIYYIIDIPIAQSYTGNKTINHISITENTAIISTPYGVSLFDLEKKVFRDSSFFFESGIYKASKEAYIKDNTVYSIIDNGLISHKINPSFPAYEDWKLELPGTFLNINGNKDLMILTGKDTVYTLSENGRWKTINSPFNEIKDVEISSSIIITEKEHLKIFSKEGMLQKIFNIKEEINSGNEINGKVYIATRFSGILNELGEKIKPDGPYNNYASTISILGDQIWIASGYWDANNDPVHRNLGYYHFNGKSWIYPDFFKQNPDKYNIFDILPNPSDPTEIFFTNYVSSSIHKGIYRMKNNTFVQRYNEDMNDWYHRPVGLAFDENNILYVSVGYIHTPFGVGFYKINPSKNTFTTIKSPLIAQTVGKPIIKYSKIWIPALREEEKIYNGGVLIHDTDGNNAIKIEKKNNLPVNYINTLDIDKNGDLWIGTSSGLAVLPNAQSSNVASKAYPIIISQNKISEELFKEADIYKITHDSGNQKWISIQGGGVYYLSANGEKTLKHFNAKNSPIPNDFVTDIKVDEASGKVYFATSDGVVAYQNVVASVSSNFGNILVYPNPVVYSHYQGNVIIKGLAEKTNISITDSSGNLVHQTVANGGFYEWNLNNEKGKKVSSGIYFVLMTNADGTDKAFAKIAVIN